MKVQVLVMIRVILALAGALNTLAYGTSNELPTPQGQTPSVPCSTELLIRSRTTRVSVALARRVLALRYRVTTRGLTEVVERGTSGILFLANHPTVVADPMLLATILYPDFSARFLIDEGQLATPLVPWVCKQTDAFIVPDVGAADNRQEAARRTVKMLEAAAEALKSGQNILLYPSGRVYREQFERVRNKGGVDKLLAKAPGTRVVLIRSRGLWGSRFSYAPTGQAPHYPSILRQSLWMGALNAAFFIPKREVEVEFFEPTDFPSDARRGEISSFLEEFFNEGAPAAMQVPDYWWQGNAPRFFEAASLPETSSGSEERSHR